MSIFALAILAFAIALLLALDTWLVRRDGYGHRPPPRSHESWEASGLPSEPYRSRR